MRGGEEESEVVFYLITAAAKSGRVNREWSGCGERWRKVGQR